MPASDVRDSARSVGRAAAIFAVIAGTLWSTAYFTATSRVAWRLYEPAFDNAVAHRFVEQMRSADGAVFLLGASSTHDGFDEGVMDAAVPGARFVNGGTGMGSIFVYEALAEILRDSHVRPATIVIGIHPVVLSDRQINFNGAGYTDFFDRWHGWDVLQFDDPLFREADRQEALTNTFWPGHRVARQVSRLVRDDLYRLHRASYWGPTLPKHAFEMAPDDLTPHPKYFYNVSAPVPGAAAAGVRWIPGHDRGMGRGTPSPEPAAHPGQRAGHQLAGRGAPDARAFVAA